MRCYMADDEGKCILTSAEKQRGRRENGRERIKYENRQ